MALALCTLLACSCAHSRPAAPAESAKLQEARRRLALAEATAARVARERAALQQRTTLAPDVVADLDAYQQSVDKLVQGQRQVVNALTVADSQPKSTNMPSTPNALPEKFAQPKSRAENLADEFGDSLAAFDEFLLQELESVDEAASGGGADSEMTAAARAAAEAANRLKERGIDVAGSGAQGAQGTSGEASAEGGTKGEADGEAVAAAGEGTGQPGGQLPAEAPQAGSKPVAGAGGAPAGTPPPGDDDIVARQLREAAERETDPVLREKLWREYRAYKEAGTRDD